MVKFAKGESFAGREAMGAMRKRQETAVEVAPFLGVTHSARGFSWRERLAGDGQIDRKSVV